MRLKFKERIFIVSFKFRPHKRPEMQTFTLGLIARSYDTKSVAFALHQRARTSNVCDKRLAWEVPLLINVDLYVSCHLLKVSFQLTVGYFESYIALLYL